MAKEARPLLAYRCLPHPRPATDSWFRGKTRAPGTFERPPSIINSWGCTASPRVEAAGGGGLTRGMSASNGEDLTVQAVQA